MRQYRNLSFTGRDMSYISARVVENIVVSDQGVKQQALLKVWSVT